MIDPVEIPILFNCLKHHLGYIRQRISGIITEEEMMLFINDLKIAGASVMDIYTGDLSPCEIAGFIEEQLKQDHHHDFDNYHAWLHVSNNYRIIRIPDDSIWVLTKSDNEERYIHIHPARGSKHSIRVNSSILKTSVAVMAYCKLYDEDPYNISIINKVRNYFPGLSPLISFSPQSRMVKLMDYLK